MAVLLTDTTDRGCTLYVEQVNAKRRGERERQREGRVEDSLTFGSVRVESCVCGMQKAYGGRGILGIQYTADCDRS